MSQDSRKPGRPRSSAARANALKAAQQILLREGFVHPCLLVCEGLLHRGALVGHRLVESAALFVHTRLQVGKLGFVGGDGLGRHGVLHRRLLERAHPVGEARGVLGNGREARLQTLDAHRSEPRIAHALRDVVGHGPRVRVGVARRDQEVVGHVGQTAKIEDEHLPSVTFEHRVQNLLELLRRTACGESVADRLL